VKHTEGGVLDPASSERLGRLLVDLAALQDFPRVAVDLRMLIHDVLEAVGLSAAEAREEVRCALLTVWDDPLYDDAPWR
jgi:hypothetical protein